MRQTIKSTQKSISTYQSPRLPIWRWIRSRLKTEEFLVSLVPYFVIISLFIWLAVLQPRSVQIGQIEAIVNLTMPVIFISISQAIVVLTGGLDLSIGGVLSVVSIIAAFNMNTPREAITTSIILVALSWIPGLINGLVIAYAGIQPFIATLATWFILGGVALTIRPGPGGIIDPSLAFLSRGEILGIPISILLLILCLSFGIWFQRTRLGFEIQAIGSDKQAAYHSGVKVRRIEITAYVLSSVLATIGGLILAAQSLSGDPKVGDGYILPSFAAVAIGGAKLSGGWASIPGSIFGALAISYLISIAYLLGLPTQWALILEAVLLILSVFFRHVVHLFYRNRQEI